MWISVARDSGSYILIEEGFFVLSFVLWKEGKEHYGFILSFI